MDFLRGILSIWVMVAHLAIWAGVAGQQIPEVILGVMKTLGIFFQPVGETHPAVVGFIVLSGYCIHRNGARRDQFSTLSYGVRRAFRIMPTYLLASLVGAAGFVYLAGVDLNAGRAITGTQQISMAGLLVKLLGISAFIPKLHYLSFQGNAPLTTVMVEIWLYVFYAIAIRYLIRGLHDAMLWRIIAGVWCFGLIMVCGHTEYYSWWHNGSLIAFLPLWWLGAMAVHKSSNRIFLLSWKWMILCYLLFTLLIESGILHGALQFLAVESRKMVLAVLFAQLIVFIDNARCRLIDWGAKIGQASYSIYAYHAPVLAVALLLTLPWWLVPWLVLAMAIGVYLTFELPLTAAGRKLAKKIGKFAM